MKYFETGIFALEFLNFHTTKVLIL